MARFVAAVGMEKLTVQTGRHSLVVLALEKRRESRFDGWLDRLVTELFITGARDPCACRDLLAKPSLQTYFGTRAAEKAVASALVDQLRAWTTTSCMPSAPGLARLQTR